MKQLAWNDPAMDATTEIERTSVSLSAYVRLVRQNRNFRHLWLAQIVSEIGDWFYSLAIYTLLLQLTGKAQSVALALVLQVLPHTFLGPLAGVVNDRISRRRVMIFADVARAGIVAAMMLVRSSSTVWLVYPLLLLETIMVSFFEPARNSVIPNITSREDLVLANTLSSTTWSVNLVIGAALGGFVGALLGRNAVFVLNALSFVASALLIGSMRFAEPHVESHGPVRARDLLGYAPIAEGLRYVRRDPRLIATMMAKAGMFVIGPSWVIFTVMGERDFPVHWQGIDPQRGAMLGMSLLMGARGIGALLGPLLGAKWTGHRMERLRVAILVGFLLEATGYTALGGTHSLWNACLWIVFAHTGGSSVWVFSTTLIQLTTEDRFRGRVFAADNALAMLTIAAGAFLAGRFMDWGYAARTVARAAGLLMFLPVMLWAWAIWSWRERIVPIAAENTD